MNFNAACIVAVIAFLIASCTLPPHQKIDTKSAEKKLTVNVSETSFNPSLKKTVKVNVEAPTGWQAKVTMNDAHGLAIRTLFDGTVESALGLPWDGKDDSGDIVPDEAYYPMVISISGTDTMVYNPPLFSGGETFTITNADISIDKGTIGYTLEKNSRIMIRAGEKKGLMLRSVVHCVPRLKGAVTEYWNGKDPDNLLSTEDLENWVLVIAGYTLPENSIITYGNKAITFEEYFLKRFADNATSFDFPLTTRTFMDTLSAHGRETNMHFTYPLSKDHAPKLVIEFPNSNDTTENGIKILQGLQRAYVDIDPDDKLFYRDQQFELCFFVDGKFVSEDEIGYVPYNWIWNTADIAEGEHIVTINISSFKDQIGTKSVKVFVKK